MKYKFDEESRKQRIKHVLSNIEVFSYSDSVDFHPELQMNYKTLVESRISDNMGTPFVDEVLFIALMCALAAFFADVIGRGIIARGRRRIREQRSADNKKRSDDTVENDNVSEEASEASASSTPGVLLVSAFTAEFSVYFITLSCMVCGLGAFAYSFSSPSTERQYNFITAPTAVMQEFLCYLFLLLFIMLNVGMFSYLYFVPTINEDMLAAERKRIQNNVEEPQPDHALTLFRACLMLLTLYSILAVDFLVFPFRHIKCETFGMSLMDTGVGCFVFSAAYAVAVKKSSRGNDHRSTQKKTITNLQRSKQWLGSSIPLFAIGGTRFVLNYLSDYQEHVTEYGQHWNFFITLGVLPFLYIIFSVIVVEWIIIGMLFRGRRNILTAAMLNPFVQGCFVLAAYQGILLLPLQATNLTEFIMGPHRRNFVEANKEGIASSFGYLGLYLVTIGGAHLLSSGGASSSLDENVQAQQRREDFHKALTVKVRQVMRDYNRALGDLENCWSVLKRTRRAEATAFEEKGSVNALTDTNGYIILTQRSRFYEEQIVSEVCENLRRIGNFFHRTTRVYLSITLSVACYVMNQFLNILVQPNSRRLCNTAYVAFILCLCFSSLAVLITLEYLFFTKAHIHHHITVYLPRLGTSSSEPSLRRFNTTQDAANTNKKNNGDKHDQYEVVHGNTQLYAATLIRDIKLREIHTRKMQLQMQSVRGLLGDTAPLPPPEDVADCQSSNTMISKPSSNHVATQSLIANAINYNQLFIFLIGNLSTGIVNKSMRTIFASHSVSFVVISLYLVWLCGVSCFLYINRIKMKFW